MTNETTTTALKLQADNQILINDTHTNVRVEQTSDGTRLVTYEMWPAEKLVTQLPQNRYTLCTEAGQKAFFNDFAAMWDAAAVNPAFLNKLYKDAPAELLSGVMNGTYPNFANVQIALCDMADEFEMSYEALAVHLVKNPQESFSVTVETVDENGQLGQVGGMWLAFQAGGDVYHSTCTSMLEHYLVCVEAGEDVLCGWAEDLYKEALEQQREFYA